MLLSSVIIPDVSLVTNRYGVIKFNFTVIIATISLTLETKTELAFIIPSIKTEWNVPPTPLITFINTAKVHIILE
jgi:hypothetical protein